MRILGGAGPVSIVRRDEFPPPLVMPTSSGVSWIAWRSQEPNNAVRGLNVAARLGRDALACLNALLSPLG
jgi:hypothetical protein